MNTEEKNVSKTKKQKIINTCVNTFLVLVLVFGIICSYTAFVSKSGSGVPDIFGLRLFSIQSGSMEPEFYEGDLIVAVRVKDASKLEIDDVITFRTIINYKQAFNTHRIIDKQDNGTHYRFTTHGDNNPEGMTEDVHSGEIVGKYLFRIPKMGSVIDFLQTSVGFLIVIVLPVFLFFVYNLVQFFRVFFSYRMQKMRLELQMEMANQSQNDSSKEKPEEDEKPAEGSQAADDPPKES